MGDTEEKPPTIATYEGWERRREGREGEREEIVDTRNTRKQC